MLRADHQSRKVPNELLHAAQQQLNQLLHTINGVDFVMLCSSDGFELALASKKNIDNTGKIAAVSSSILAMVSAFITEIHLQGCNTITLDAENGKVILTAVDHPKYPMVLVALASKDVLIGQLSFYIKKVADFLANCEK